MVFVNFDILKMHLSCADIHGLNKKALNLFNLPLLKKRISDRSLNLQQSHVMSLMISFHEAVILLARSFFENIELSTYHKAQLNSFSVKKCKWLSCIWKYWFLLFFVNKAHFIYSKITRLPTDIYPTDLHPFNWCLMWLLVDPRHSFFHLI